MLDLKPQNVLLDDDGCAVLADFGLARVLREGDTHASVSVVAELCRLVLGQLSGTVCTLVEAQQVHHLLCMVTQAASGAGGTWAYMAPEQYGSGSSCVRPAADMWGFGATMRHLLSGKPLPANWAILSKTPDLQLPAEARAVPGLAELLKQCLQRQPEGRPSCAEARKRLHAMLHDGISAGSSISYGDHDGAQGSSGSGDDSDGQQVNSALAVIPELVDLLHSSDADVQADAAAKLENLADGNPSTLAAIAQAGAIEPLVRLLDSSSVEAQQWAAGALWSLADGNLSSQAAVALTMAIQPLVRLLDSSDPGTQLCAAGSLRSLADGNPSNQAAMVQAGAIPPLVRLLDSSSAGVPEQAAGALARIGADNQAAIVQAGAIQPLVRLLVSSSMGVQEQAAGALRSLAAGNPSNQAAIAQSGAFQPLVRLLGSSSPGVKEQASAALVVLHGINQAATGAPAGQRQQQQQQH
jgi:HEAT repeat protein